MVPVILHEQANQGRTIIEKLIGESDVGYAVVLLSPDDHGYAVTAGKTAEKARARQNVIFELGFFLGKLGEEQSRSPLLRKRRIRHTQRLRGSRLYPL